MVKAYKSILDAQKDMPKAMAQLTRGGDKAVLIEKHNGGYVIAEYKIINEEYIFQRYYNGE